MHDKDPPIHQSYPVEAIVGVTAAATIMIFYVGVVIFKGLMVIMSESGRGYVAINQDEAKCEPKMEGTIMIGKGKEKDPKPPGGKPVQYYLPPIKDHRSSGDTVSGLARL